MNMYSHRRTLPLILVLGSAVCAAADLPTEWIDPATGHRVIRLSREDGTQSLYFNQNAYTADGKKLIVTTAGGGIATITLATREVRPLVAGPVSVLVAGHKTGDVYYIKRLPGGTDDLRRRQGPAAARLVDGHARRCAARPVHDEYQDGGGEGHPAGARVAGPSAIFAGRRKL